MIEIVDATGSYEKIVEHGVYLSFGYAFALKCRVLTAA